MKISIIIPVYNAAKTIRRAIASIDTKHQYEIICINDGSTDDSKATLEQLQKEYKNVIIINQENKGAATSRNVGISSMTGDVFMFLDADDQFLPSRIDFMADYYQKDENVDIVIGQIARDSHDTWHPIYSHQAIQKLEKVNLAQCPEMMQSIGPGAKMFSAQFADLRFDEDVVFCEEHTFMIDAFKKARDIQLLPTMVYGYNVQEGSVTDQRADQFNAYISDAQKVRARVMEALLLRELRVYYSYRMDELIVSYLVQAFIEKQPTITQTLITSVTAYMEAMQQTDCSGEAMFRLVKVIEQGGKKWDKSLYQQWRETLLKVGIGRPNYYRFQVEVLPKRAKFKSRTKLKQFLKR
ncbi:glycosyltransferase family 2 protein [Staphylococcus caeli]|uniref:Teichoic acid biosynthesis protein n=1 Tax=Staphylococcus caeli TaxID=2201815 RepID=A0A1D4GIM0_9STAP|nr:glycosyltransferase family 2 protein [Staphylococcus caeli]SCS24858.1 teichoic acid biosynthesis protein [Staphylococcus caeli]SCS41476.1 teichoic acid biosynthesis protein [Staphylococcus caeli]